MADIDTRGRRIGAAFISLIVPGAGHVYRGRLHRGVAWFAVLALIFVTMPWSGAPGFAAAMAARFLIVPADAALCRSGQPSSNGFQIGVAGTMLVVMVSLGLLVREHMVAAFKVPSASMCPTMQIGDLFFVNRLAEPELGDVIAFRHPLVPRDFLSRVVAVGGDRVAVKEGVLHRNGAPVPRGPRRPCHYDDQDEANGAWERAERVCEEETLGSHRFTVMLDPDRGAGFAYDDFPRLDGDRPPRFDASPGSRARPPRLVVEDGAYVVPAGHVFVMGDNRDNSNDSRYWGPVPVGNVHGTAMYVWWSRGPDGVRWGRLGHTID